MSLFLLIILGLSTCTLLVLSCVFFTGGDTEYLEIGFVFLFLSVIVLIVIFAKAIPDAVFDINKEVVIQKVKIDYIKQTSGKIIYVIDDTTIEETDIKWFNTNRIRVRVEYYKNKTNRTYFLIGEE